MQTQGVQTTEIPISGGSFLCKQGGDFDTLATTVAAAVADYVDSHANAQLIDISLAGGGAGNVFMATLLLVPGSGGVPSTEQVANMTFKWFTASDHGTLQSKMNAYLLTLAVTDALWAWETACAGDGAVWIAVLVTYELPPG